MHRELNIVLEGSSGDERENEIRECCSFVQMRTDQCPDEEMCFDEVRVAKSVSQSRRKREKKLVDDDGRWIKMTPTLPARKETEACASSKNHTKVTSTSTHWSLQPYLLFAQATLHCRSLSFFMEEACGHVFIQSRRICIYRRGLNARAIFTTRIA